MAKKPTANSMLDLTRIGGSSPQPLAPNPAADPASIKLSPTGISNPESSMINKSYSKMLGGLQGIGGNKFKTNSENIKQSRARLMQLEDSNSMKGALGIDKSEEFLAKRLGFDSIEDMQNDAKRKRRKEEFNESMANMGFSREGGRWVKT